MNLITKTTNYVKSAIEELKKVIWPSKKDLYNHTLLVIALSLAIAIFLGALDFIFSKGFEFIIS